VAAAASNVLPLRVDEPQKSDSKVVDNDRVQALAREVERVTFPTSAGSTR
jgi:hypothetical protein